MSDKIKVPRGASSPFCLYVDPRWEADETLLFLCNASSDAITDVEVASAFILMREFYVLEPDERWAKATPMATRRWDAIPPGEGVLLDMLSHEMWDLVTRHRLTFRDAAGGPWRAEVVDLALNASRLGQEPDKVWVPIAAEQG